MKSLANSIHNNLLDMDFADYEELKELDLENLLYDLELLKKHGNGALLNIIKMLLED